MNKKRTHIEVIRDILGVVKNRSGKIKPTHILYKSNLSYQMMSDYLKELTEKYLITEQKLKNGKTYAITNKGSEFLDNYSLVNDFANSYGLNFN